MTRVAMLCPICKKPVPDPAPTEPRGDYPFCSERCKLIDLGRWLEGKYQIPLDTDDEDESRPGDEAEDRE